MFKNLTKEERAWVLYDVGNSAFTMLACSLIPIWFKSLAIGTAPGQITGDQATAYYSLSIAIVTVIVALLGPILGAIADHKDTKKIFFTTAVALGVVGCILNGFATTWVAFIVIYILAKIFYQASLTFYDSMLNDVTTEDRMDQVSSYGYAWGYIGSCIPFTVALVAYVLGPDMFGKIPGNLSKIIGFTVTGIWWFLVTLPLIKNYKQRNYVETEKHAIAKAFAKIGRTLKKIALEDKKVLFFLIAFFLYIDGVGTIIDNCINIGTDLGLNTVGQVIFLLATQVVAWIGSLVFARLSTKHDTVPLILVCIVGYFAVCLYALTLSTIWHFGILAFGVGCFQGSIQSLSRSYYSKIIPPENSGEYFGLYDIFAKGASFLGSAVIAAVKLAGGTINIAVASLAVFFALGFIFLKISDKQPMKNR
ncbi:MAG: MFS transporter [Lachnospiraceae bacterium]|nr:MFS transporter [Lachnospiraceae bacterium]MBQ9562402.1 MFS transporter [Lachnospiraceae bacterium]MBQ9593985.1 MFS transporter [Lachnospiraceae bacterium]